VHIMCAKRQKVALHLLNMSFMREAAQLNVEDRFERGEGGGVT